ncbi:hypothetical protein [Desulforamulus aquiferis]|uniref:Uncharacterized protein n=1 Tax=Desulforamulus aquiferis TaxID=1397668 RepID=A0AAW7ZE45_9FIRM|nr:hypothetical protein [Desulforamulus aquiferis]MDO7787632.1 hypothetical protein [Desulforamulus aquiferis]RYD02983.1 hypothetical protein N752_21460 [Desulforamulus aquiferis]
MDSATPMAKDLVVPYETLEEAISTGEEYFLNEVLRIARITIQNGGKVIIRKEHLNPNRQDIEEFTKLDEIDKWEKGLRRDFQGVK